MPLYQYRPLEEESGEIRLVSILPARFDDPIRVTISHVPLHVHHSKVPSIEDIKGTLPDDWEAYETLEGRIIFRGPEGTTWAHPNTGIPRHLYDPPLENQHTAAGCAYETLSYTWGPPDDPQTIRVTPETAGGDQPLSSDSEEEIDVQDGDAADDGHIHVRRRLFEVIKHLRYPDRPRVMWIDAICINQDSIPERNKQVPRMREIYRIERKAVAWLGPPFHNSDLACDTINHLGRQVVVTRQGQMLPRPGALEPDWYKREFPLPFSAEIWEALRRLITAPWFQRLWVVQEIQLSNAASVFQCGHHQIPWPVLRQAMLCIFGKDHGLPIAMRQQGYSMYDMLVHIHDASFQDMLWCHLSRECTNPRDKIFGLMSMAPALIAKAIHVDYSKEPLEVYKDTAMACEKVTNRLDMLRFCGGRLSPDSPPDGPTWVPNLTGKLCCNNPIFAHFASGNSASNITLSTPAKLQVSGLCVASISVVTSLDVENYDDVLRHLKELNPAELDKEPYPTGETALEGYLRGLAFGQFEDKYPNTGAPPFEVLKRDITSLAEFSGGNTNSQLPDRFRTDLPFRLRNCWKFATDRGYVGFTKLIVLPGMIALIASDRESRIRAATNITGVIGDVVSIILGCSTPMILRPTSNNEYQVVGDCYCHGLMDGEALLGNVQRPWTVIGQKRTNSIHVYTPVFFNAETGQDTLIDPRLDKIPLPPDWEHLSSERCREDPRICVKFRNKITGERINSDPRLSPEALLARGVELKDILLV